ncbi:MAG: right-handed parallel beta-helix repeat-containing protein [Minisyncoccia bacterium]
MLITKQSVFFFIIFIFVSSIFLPTFVRAETYIGDISINSTGGGNCALVGVWDDLDKTCTLTKDLSGPLNIGSTGITLDGAGHTVSRNVQAPFFQRLGITVSGSNAVIKNINVESFSSCLVFNGGTTNSRVENSAFSYCGSHGIYLFSSSGGHTFLNNNFTKNFLGIFVNSPNNTIEGNAFSANNTYGVRTYFVSNNTIKNNIFSDNGFGLRMEYGIGNKVTDNTIQNSRSNGVYAFSSTQNQNYIVNNNFINNGDGQVSWNDLNQYYDAMPVGGNYWSDYDAPSEGCADLNSDSICDGPRYFNIYNHTYGDFNPWVRRDGWKTSPPTCFDGIQNQDETDVDVGGVCKILSSEKSVISFSFESLTPSVAGVVNETDHTISATVPFGTDVTALIPSIVISTGASIGPSDNLAQDFSSPVAYTVTAEDKSTQAYTVTVTPSCVVDCFSSVLFLPGLEASRLYTPRTDGSEDQLWEPNGNSDVEDLYLNTDGGSRNSNIYTRDIIKETNTPIPTGLAGQNIYKSFADTMGQLMDDSKIAAWQPFPYDWRQGAEEVVNTQQKLPNGETASLVNVLQSLVASSKNGKVTIVAHSNGGLVAKALLKKLQDDKVAGVNNLINKVDVLILVAVPEIGTAKAVPSILHGYDQQIVGGLLVDETHARELGRNMKSAYGLLPSIEYINRVSASPVTFVDTAIPSNVTTKLVQTFGSAISSYSEYKDFLFGAEGRTDPAISQTNLPISLSQNLFSQAESLHDSIDNFALPASLRVIEVAGWGLDTVASFEYYPKTQQCGQLACPFALDERPRFTRDGDGTVVVPSAHYRSFLGSAEKYWVDIEEHNKELGKLRRNREHKDILEINQVNNFIESVIDGENINFDTVFKNSKPVDTSNRIRLSIHSPVTIDAYDHEENHTGKICPQGSDFCYAEENILNSSYLEFGEGKYINLPEDEMAKIKLQGTDIGTFTYESEKVLPDETAVISSFIDIPVTTQTQGEITLNQAGIPQLALDVTGDGVTDFNLLPSATFDPILYLQIMKVTIDSLELNQGQIKAFDNRVDIIIKSIQGGKIDNTKLKAEIFKSALQKTLSKPDLKTTKPKKLSKTDAQLLLDMLNKLLDNLN